MHIHSKAILYLRAAAAASCVHTDNILDVLSIEFHRCVEKTR
jgi:hypothetical protein